MRHLNVSESGADVKIRTCSSKGSFYIGGKTYAHQRNHHILIQLSYQRTICHASSPGFGFG